jgi:hypothetical protein
MACEEFPGKFPDYRVTPPEWRFVDPRGSVR